MVRQELGGIIADHNGYVNGVYNESGAGQPAIDAAIWLEKYGIETKQLGVWDLIYVVIVSLLWLSFSILLHIFV